MRYVFLLLMLGLAGCATPNYDVNSCEKTGTYSAADVGNAGHRMGDAVSKDITENTLEALYALLATGHRKIEFDVRTTKDRQLVVLHDKNFCRVAGINLNVHDMIYEYLPTLYNGEYVPLVDEVIQVLYYIPGGMERVTFDIKQVDDRALGQLLSYIMLTQTVSKRVKILLADNPYNRERTAMYCKEFKALGLDVLKYDSQGSWCDSN